MAPNCVSDDECVEGFLCLDNVCVQPLDGGAPCTSADQCASGTCRGGFCCTGTCDGPCETCAPNTGSCEAIPSGQAPEPQDGCFGGLCDGEGSCQAQCTDEQTCMTAWSCLDQQCTEDAQALALDGVDDYADWTAATTTGNAFHTTAGWTLAMWFRAPHAGATDERLLECSQADGRRYGFLARSVDTDRDGLATYIEEPDGSRPTEVTWNGSADGVFDDAWHLALLVDAPDATDPSVNRWSLYVDGVAAGMATGTGTYTPPTNGFDFTRCTIGASADATPTSYAQAAIHSVATWTAAPVDAAAFASSLYDYGPGDRLNFSALVNANDSDGPGVAPTHNLRMSEVQQGSIPDFGDDSANATLDTGASTTELVQAGPCTDATQGCPRAASMDSAGDGLRTPATAEGYYPWPDAPVAIEFWYLPRRTVEDVPSNSQIFGMWKNGSADYLTLYQVDLLGGSRLKCRGRIGDGQTSQDFDNLFTALKSFKLDQWNHVLIQFQADGQVFVYLNGDGVAKPSQAMQNAVWGWKFFMEKMSAKGDARIANMAILAGDHTADVAAWSQAPVDHRGDPDAIAVWLPFADGEPTDSVAADGVVHDLVGDHDLVPMGSPALIFDRP